MPGSDHLVDITYVKDVCKPGYGSATCRYLVAGGQGFECAKLTSLKSVIDSRVNQMHAKGDNCDGK